MCCGVRLKCYTKFDHTVGLCRDQEWLNLTRQKDKLLNYFYLSWYVCRLKSYFPRISSMCLLRRKERQGVYWPQVLWVSMPSLKSSCGQDSIGFYNR